MSEVADEPWRPAPEVADLADPNLREVLPNVVAFREGPGRVRRRLAMLVMGVVLGAALGALLGLLAADGWILMGASVAGTLLGGIAFGARRPATDHWVYRPTVAITTEHLYAQVSSEPVVRVPLPSLQYWKPTFRGLTFTFGQKTLLLLGGPHDDEVVNALKGRAPRWTPPKVNQAASQNERGETT